jgi:hypothetical protein
LTQVYLWETKTTSEDLSPGSVYWRRTILDPQISLYIPAIRELGYDPRGCIYDVLRKPAQKPSKKGETPQRYGERCLNAIAEKPERYYARGLVVRMENEEREAAADTWNTATQMREARRLRLYPRNPDSCMTWSRACDYLNVCSGFSAIDDPVLFQNEPAHVELDKGEGHLSDDLNLLTQSSMRAYRSCPRKFYYRYSLRQRPLKKPETLSTGSSIHEALDVYRRTGGDFEAAKRALTTEEPFVRVKEEAMIMGYVARWGPPKGILAIEHQFQIQLVNPETGAPSRTFKLGGKVDAIVAAEAAGELMNPAATADNLEQQLEMSIGEDV